MQSRRSRRSVLARVVLLGAAAVLLLSLPGCHRMTIDATGLEPHVYMSADARDAAAERLGRLEAEDDSSWLFWGLLSLREADVESLVERELARANGDAVTGMRIVTTQTFVDGLVEALTLGVYARRTLRVDGIIVRQGPAGGGR